LADLNEYDSLILKIRVKCFGLVQAVLVDRSLSGYLECNHEFYDSVLLFVFYYMFSLSI